MKATEFYMVFNIILAEMKKIKKISPLQIWTDILGINV